MKKNTFTASDKVIGLGKGNLDFFKSTDSFREKVQLFADGINTLNDKSLQYRDTIQTEQKALENYLKELYTNSSEIEAREKRIKDLEEAYNAIRTEIREKMPTYDEMDKSLFYAYRTYILGEEDSTSGNTYKRAFMEWLDNAGIVPTDKGISYLMSQMGAKKASAKTMCKNGGTVFTENMGEKQYLELVYRTVATMMYKVNALKKYTYEYVIEEKKVVKVTK